MTTHTSYRALTIAKYFLSLQDEESGELISNMKLQKLLYYAQGYYVAIHGKNKSLFNDKIFAWQHGPVVRSVYQHYADYGSSALPVEDQPEGIAVEDLTFLNEIHRFYGKYSAWKLRDLTHEESPWISSYQPGFLESEILPSALRKHFKEYVE